MLCWLNDKRKKNYYKVNTFQILLYLLKKLQNVNQEGKPDLYKTHKNKNKTAY